MSKTEITTPEGTPEIISARTFAAPAELVFRAYTEPELLKRWLGPSQYEIVVHEWELRHGGRWRFAHVGADGAEFAFHGVFHNEPSVESGIVQTWEFEGAAGHVSLESAKFVETDGGTQVRGIAVYQSVADRDALLASGMEGGMNESYDRLETLLAELSQA